METLHVEGMRIRTACEDDLPAVQAVYARARQLMIDNGNPNQWGLTHPPESMVKEDIELGRLMLLVDDEGEHGAERLLAQFALCEGVEPTYLEIDGAWLDDDDYVCMHRLASSGLVPHSARACIDWTVERCGNVRVDTHPDNAAMRHVFETEGFTQCGVIQVDQLADGDHVRIAYQRHDR